MKKQTTFAAILFVFATGYLAGSLGLFGESETKAQNPFQDDPKSRLVTLDISNETVAKIRAANDALNDAMEALKAEGKYTSATEGVNAFVVLSGGGNPKEDLENGKGVDPETFAALYAGKALDEVKDELTFDQEGRLLYKGKLVRLYPIQKLKAIGEHREKVLTGKLKP